MRFEELNDTRGIKPLKHTLRENPHLVLEPNFTCNQKCKACYNLDKDYVKSLEEIKQEINTALTKRNLDTISILGGDPTLHPQLPEIIAFIKSKRLICQILTNGLIFLEDKDDHLLKTCIKNGVDRIILHTDSGQPEPEEQREKNTALLFDKFESCRIYFSLSMTVYHENSGTLPELIKKYSRYKFFDGILALLQRDARITIQKNLSIKQVELKPEYDSLYNGLKLEPVTYIPSSLDDGDISWLMYFYYINSYTNETLRISPLINRIFRRIYRFFMGRQVFGMAPKPVLFVPTFLITILAEIAFNQTKIKDAARLIRKSKFLTKLRFQYIVIQSGPEYNSKYRKIQLCYHCPDATIRNGKITPVCLADMINPVQPVPERKIENELYKTVYEHLEEI